MSFQYEKDKGSDSNVSLLVILSFVLFAVLMVYVWFNSPNLFSTFPLNLLITLMLLVISFVSVNKCLSYAGLN